MPTSSLRQLSGDALWKQANVTNSPGKTSGSRRASSQDGPLLERVAMAGTVENTSRTSPGPVATESQTHTHRALGVVQGHGVGQGKALLERAATSRILKDVAETKQANAHSARSASSELAWKALIGLCATSLLIVPLCIVAQGKSTANLEPEKEEDAVEDPLLPADGNPEADDFSVDDSASSSSDDGDAMDAPRKPIVDLSSDSSDDGDAPRLLPTVDDEDDPPEVKEDKASAGASNLREELVAAGDPQVAGYAAPGTGDALPKTAKAKTGYSVQFKDIGEGAVPF